MLLLLFRGIEQGNRRKAALDQRIDEQRSLLLFEHTLARLGRLGRSRRRDNRRHTLVTFAHVLGQGFIALDDALLDLGLLTTVAHHGRCHLTYHVVHFTELGNHLLALRPGIPPAAEDALDEFYQIERDLAGDVHHLEPGQVRKNGQAKQEERQQRQGTALHVERKHG